MPCIHRFHKILLPPVGMKYLFIGTFNPIWDVSNGDNPDYFYGRDKSQFWCILPHAFNKNCLVDKDKIEKKKFCEANKIGLTDLIYCLKNVDESNSNDLSFLTKGFKDESFEMKMGSDYRIEIEFFTPALMKFIKANQHNLKGVFFTRKTNRGIMRIWEEWLKIKKFCAELDIYADELPSPSVRGGGIRSKIFSWRKAIEFSQQK